MRKRITNWLQRHFLAGKRRRRAWAKHFERVGSEMGIFVYKHHLVWTDDSEVMTMERRWGDAEGLPADRCQTLYSLGQWISKTKLAGDTAEAGVRLGKGSLFLLAGLRDRDRPHHLCDSFEGLSEPSQHDRLSNGEHRWESGKFAVDLPQVRANFASHPQTLIHQGWIPHCFADMQDRKFALAHIDVDLYEPTLDSLKFFYPRLVPGGVIVCDDYGFASCPGARKALDEFFADKPEGIIELPTGQALVFKRTT